MARKRTEYSDVEKASVLAALDANGGDRALTSRMTGVPDSTLQNWATGHSINSSVEAMRRRARGLLADQLEDLAWKVAGVLQRKLESARAGELARVLKVAVESMQLLRGQATQITEHIDGELTDAERAERLMGLLNAARARSGGVAAAREEGFAYPVLPAPADGAPGDLP